MRYLLMLTFLCWGGVTDLCAQHNIFGTITNSNGEGLGGSHVHVNENFSIADPDGHYNVVVPHGWHRLYISHVGYKKLDTLVQVTSDLELNLKLKQAIAELAEVVIPERAAAPTPDLVLGRDMVERFSNESLGDLLSEIPGISAMKSGTAVVKPVINGLHSSRVLVINNAVRMEDHQWGAEHAPNIDVNSAGTVSLIKGAEALRFGGDAIAGVIMVEPPSIPVRDTLYGHTIINGATNGRGGSISSALYQGRKSGWNYNGLGTVKFLGDRESPDYVLSNTGNREYSAGAGLGFKGDGFGFRADYSFYHANIGILRASHIGNITDLVLAINNDAPTGTSPFTYEINAPRQQVAHHLAKAVYYRNLPFGKLTLQYAFQFNNRQEFDIRRSERNKPSLDLDLATHSLNADVESKFDETSVKAGLAAHYQNNSANPETGVRPLIPNYDKLDIGAYATASRQLTQKLRLEAGGRYDFSRIDADKFYLKSRWESNGYETDFNNIITGDFGTQWRTNPAFDYHNLSAVIGVAYSLDNNTQWISNFSIASRNPNPSELFSDGLHHASGQIEIGDLRLQKEVGYKISTAVKFASDKWRYQINPFLNYIDDFILARPAGLEQSIRSAFPVWVYDQAAVRIYGIDASAEYSSDEFKFGSNVAYAHGTNLGSGKPLIHMPPVQLKNSVVYNVERWNNFSAGLTSESSFFQSRYPNDDFVTDVFIDGETTPVLVGISRPPAGYHLLHFNSSVRFAAFGKSALQVALNVHNILNTSYRDYLNRNRFYADEIGRNVTVQIKLNY